MNATERIRAALQKPAATTGSEVPPSGKPPENGAPEPVESTLRLVSTGDQQRATMAGPPTAKPQQDPPAQAPAVTVKLLREQGKATPIQRETAPAPEKQREPVPARVSAPLPAPAPARSVEAATELRMWAADVPARRKGVDRKWFAIGAAVVLVAIAAVVFRSVWMPGHSAPAAVSALQLGVESEDNGLISLRWNALSVPVAQAREGRLSIVEDQKAPRTVPMSAGQLGAGHLFYESTSDRVEFQLEVVEKSGAVVRESVVAAKKPEPASATSAAATAQTPQQVAAANQAAPAPADNTPVEETPKPVQPAPRAFTPPPVTAVHNKGSEGRLILMEPAPTLAGGSPVPAGAMLPARVDIIPPPPTAPGARGSAAAQASNATPATPRRVAVGGRLQSAMLLRKVAPTYPALARQMRIQGLVRFQAVIGKEGEVQDLQFVSGPRALEKAAADAVKRWVYRPTLLNGRPVEVSTQIEINFSLGN